MRLNTLGLTTAAVASLVILSACNKAANAPTAPAANAVAPATTAAPALAAAAPATPMATPAPTRGRRGGGKVRQACAADIAKFCAAGEKPWKCLKPHESELSQTCQAARAQAKAARQARMGGGIGPAAAQ